MKKLLMIAPYFLPRRRVGSLRPFKFAIHLKDYGWEPHIITIASDGQLTPKEQDLLQDIEVHTLTPPFDRTSRSGSQQTKSTKRNSAGNSATADWIDKHFPVDTWWPFFGLKIGEIKRIADKINLDALWSTGDPWSAHWVGKKLANHLSGTFWMADFRDPWTLSDTNLKKRSIFASAVDSSIEPRWIRQASMLSFTTEQTRKLYEEHYADLDLRTTTIYNAFDRELFNDGEQEATNLKFDPKKLNLVFFGRFRRLSKAKPIIDILSELQSQDPSAAEKIAVHSFGQLTNSDQNYLSQKGVEHCFEIQEPVPAEQSLQVLQKADILLLSTNPERTSIIPAKLWDYLAAGRPILSIAPNPEIEKILEQTGTGQQYSVQNSKRVSEILKNCVAAKEQNLDLPISFVPDKQKIGRYSAESATEKLAAILDNHTG